MRISTLILLAIGAGLIGGSVPVLFNAWSPEADAFDRYIGIIGICVGGFAIHEIFRRRN